VLRARTIDAPDLLALPRRPLPAGSDRVDVRLIVESASKRKGEANYGRLSKLDQ
jgi:hypothetical protein